MQYLGALVEECRCDRFSAGDFAGDLVCFLVFY